MSVIEVAEAAGEHNDLFGETLSKFFDIPVLYIHQNCPYNIHFGFYNPVHISLNEVLIQDSEETIYNAEINDSSYESQPGDWGFFLKNPITENQKMSFFSSTNIKFTIWEQFLQFKACKFVEIDAIGIKRIRSPFVFFLKKKIQL